MWTLIIIIAIVTWAWFFYTDRRNTVTATKTSVGVVGGFVKETASIVKTEAQIAKTKNDIADIETDRLQKFADRNAQRIVSESFEDIGLGKNFRSEQEQRLADIKAKLEAAKVKAGK